jgi:hypothetical protein
MAVDEVKLEQFMGQFVQDMGAAASGALVAIGDQLGLYRALGGDAGFTRVRRATETPFNLVLEARP